MDYLRACDVKCNEKMTMYDKNERTRQEETMPFKPIFNNSFEGPEET
jgi:hypothetical protein